MRLSVAAFAALFVIALPPGAAFASTIRTVTFTGIDPSFSVWLEDGVTAQASSFEPFTIPDALHLDRDGTPHPQNVAFTTGALFSVVSLDIRGGGSGYCSIPSDPGATPFGLGSDECFDSGSDFDDPIPYIQISGFRDGALVTVTGLYRPSGPAFETILLGDSFTELDILVVEALTYSDLGLPGSCDLDQGCGHFDLDNVTLRDATNPIPEPGAALVYGLGVAFVGWRVSRRPERSSVPDHAIRSTASR